MKPDFDISIMQDASILTLTDLRPHIQLDPEYQREGGVWSLYKQQLFIDSLLNKYDVPKFYFHRLTGQYKHMDFQFAIIDGRQRLEAIWGFLDNAFPLDKDFVFLEDTSLKLGGAYFKDFASVNPRLTTRLYGRSLTVMLVVTEDIDFIEDMFTRLNEAVPLNAAEKRNSFGGPLPRVTRELVRHPFFTEYVKIAGTRYRHHDLVAKMLWIAHSVARTMAIPDTKKATLDSFYSVNRNSSEESFDALRNGVTCTLDHMSRVFGERDPLLRSPGIIPVYFILFMGLIGAGKTQELNRGQLVDFEAARERNRRRFRAEEDDVDFKLIEYDELAQSSNDAASIFARLEILREFLKLPKLGYQI